MSELDRQSNRKRDFYYYGRGSDADIVLANDLDILVGHSAEPAFAIPSNCHVRRFGLVDDAIPFCLVWTQTHASRMLRRNVPAWLWNRNRLVLNSWLWFDRISSLVPYFLCVLNHLLNPPLFRFGIQPPGRLRNFGLPWTTFRACANCSCVLIGNLSTC